jgi:tetratricopeptide (TPR) repeat protein
MTAESISQRDDPYRLGRAIAMCSSTRPRDHTLPAAKILSVPVWWRACWCLFILFPPGIPCQITTGQLQALQNQAIEQFRSGHLTEAAEAGERALKEARQLYSPRDVGLVDSLNLLGDILKAQRRSAEAKVAYAEAVQILEHAPNADQGDLATLMNSLGQVETDLGQFVEAETSLEQSLNIRKNFKGDVALAGEVYNNLALLQVRLGRFKEAEDSYKEALKMITQARGDHSPDAATVLNGLAELYRETARYPQAIDFQKQALQIRELVLKPEDFQIATSLNNLGLAYIGEGEYTKAEDLFNRSLDIRRRVTGDSSAATALALNNLALLYGILGRFEEAKSFYQQALDIRKRVLGPEHPETLQALANLGDMSRELGEFDVAEALLSESLTLHEKLFGPDSLLTANVLRDLAKLYGDQGRTAKGLALASRLLTIAKRVYGPNSDATVSALVVEANIDMEADEDASAETPLTDALKIWEVLPAHAGAENPGILNNLAGLYRRRGQLGKAEETYSRSLAMLQATLGPNCPDIANPLQGLGDIYSVQGHYDKAEAAFARALMIYEHSFGPSHFKTAIALNNLATLYDATNRFEQAETLYLRAISISRDALGSSHPTTASLLYNLGDHYKTRRMWPDALFYLAEALKSAELSLGSGHSLTAHIRDDLARVRLLQGDRAAAISLLKNAGGARLEWLWSALRLGSETTRRAGLRGLQQELHLIISVQNDDQELARLGLAMLLEGKDRVVEDTTAALDAIRQRQSGPDQSILRDLQANWQEQSRLSRRDDLATKKLTDKLHDQEDALLSRLSSKASLAPTYLDRPTTVAIASTLNKAALLEYVEFQTESTVPIDGKVPPNRDLHYGVYTLTANNFVRWQDLGPVDRIDNLVREYRSEMSTPGNDHAARQTGGELDALVFFPIRQSLPHYKEFYFAPDGLLRLLPFSGLSDERGRLSVRAYVIHNVGTGRDLLGTRSPVSAGESMVGGLASFGRPGRYADLTNALEEVRAVSRIIPGAQRIAPDQFTKDFFQNRVISPRILHLVTHGDFARGSLAIKDANISEDNVLTTQEVAALNLVGTQLVVLSACDTAVASVTFADGLTGFQRSLTLAGAHSELLALWPVDDIQTPELMVQFYENVFKKKKTLSASLRKVQVRMAKKGVPERYWAPFVLYGKDVYVTDKPSR